MWSSENIYHTSGFYYVRPEFCLEPVYETGFQFCGSLLTFLNVFLVWLYKGLTLLVAHIMGFGCNRTLHTTDIKVCYVRAKNFGYPPSGNLQRVSYFKYSLIFFINLD